MKVAIFSLGDIRLESNTLSNATGCFSPETEHLYIWNFELPTCSYRFVASSYMLYLYTALHHIAKLELVAHMSFEYMYLAGGWAK